MCNCNPTSSTSSSSSVIPVGSGGCGTCQDGVSSYTYIAYANTVSNQGIGNPNYTVTGFGANPTANTQWLGIITTSSPIANPTSANFNTFWTQIAGPGAGGGSGTMEVQEFGTSVVPSATILNFLASDLTGVNVTNMGNGIADIDIATSAFRKITRTAALLDITNSALRAGTTYWIYDVGDGLGHTTAATAYAGIILRAASANLFDSTGIFISRNVNRTAVPILWTRGTNYTLGTFVENFNGVFEATVASTNATLNPAENPGEWTFIGRADNTKYVTEIHRCAYDVITDSILERADNRGNVITTYNSAGNSNNDIILKCFRWGYNISTSRRFINNKISVNLDSITSSGTAMPSQKNVRLNAVDGEVSNNIIEIVANTNAIGTSSIAVILTAPTVTNVKITNNTIRNSEIALSTNMRMIANDFTETRIYGNSYVANPPSGSNSHIYGNKGSFEIVNNTSNTGNNWNDPTAFIYNTEVINCTGQPRIPSADPSLSSNESNSIVGNVGTSVYNCNFKQGAVNDNVNMFIYGCNLEIGGFINQNIADGRSDSLRFISQTTLRSEAGIYCNTFKGLPNLVGGYVQKIIYGTITNRYSYIANVLFDSSISLSPILDGTTYTVKNAQLAGFTLDNVHIDGAYVLGAFPGNPVPANYVPSMGSFVGSATVPFLPKQVNDSYAGVNLTNAANNSYAFLNIEDTSIYSVATTTLTIPNSCVHAKTFVLYRVPDAGITITKIIINTAYKSVNTPAYLNINVSLSYIGPWRFINGTGLAGSAAGVTFSLTGVLTVTSDQIVRSGSPALSSVTLLRSSEFIEITRNAAYYTLNNVQIVA